MLKLLKDRICKATSERMQPIMKGTIIIKSRRQPKNLKRLLTSAAFQTSSSETNSVKKCDNKKCKCCDHIQTTTSIDFESGYTFHINDNMDCNSRNLIYVITCTGCGGQYIGETGDILRNRVRVHRQQIKDPNTRMLKLSEHIDNCSTQDPVFLICPFYKLRDEDVILRREKEQYFINKFKPKLNNL